MYKAAWTILWWIALACSRHSSYIASKAKAPTSACTALAVAIQERTGNWSILLSVASTRAYRHIIQRTSNFSKRSEQLSCRQTTRRAGSAVSARSRTRRMRHTVRHVVATGKRSTWRNPDGSGQTPTASILIQPDNEVEAPEEDESRKTTKPKERAKKKERTKEKMPMETKLDHCHRLSTTPARSRRQ